MSRLNKYMVYNPKKSKPVKYYSKLDTAFEVANNIRDKEKEDVLVLQVIGIAQCESPVKAIKKIINNVDWNQCNRCDGCGIDNGCLDEDCATYQLNKIRKALEE